jgi:metallo-beta-lactamase class B
MFRQPSIHSLAALLWLVLPSLAISQPVITPPRPVLAVGESHDITPELAVKRLTDAAFLVRHKRPWPANSLILQLTDGTLVFVGSPYEPRTTDALLDWTKEFFGDRKRVAINTHYHPDGGTGGNPALIKAGIPVYGSDLTLKAIREKGPQMMASTARQIEDPVLRGRFEQPALVPPDHIFKAQEGLTLKFGGDSVVVYYPGPAHTEDNVVVYFPTQHVLFGGCLVRDGSLGNIAEANLEAWSQAIKNLSRFDATLVVPGHGNSTAKDLLTGTMRLLETKKAGTAPEAD